MPSSYSSALAHVREIFSSTGVSFGECPVPSVFLTDTLEQTARRSMSIGEGFESRDSESAKRVHQGSSFPLIIGNPPYRQFSENKGEWIDTLMSDYKVGLLERKHNVDNDYVKFIRFASWRVEEDGRGMVAFITPNTHLNAPTFRVMRSHLLQTFNDIYILDLHGSAMMENTSLEGDRDENVFDIRQGVCISFLIKTEKNKLKQTGRVRYFSLRGSREEKLSWMRKTSFENIPWQEVFPNGDSLSFVPRSFSLNDSASEQQGLSLDSIFGCRSSGIQTKNDGFLYTKTREELLQRIERLATLSEEQVRALYPELRDSSGWTLARAMQHARIIAGNNALESVVHRVFYRPYELRWTVITNEGGGLVGRPRFDVMRLFLNNMAERNLGIVTTRQLSSREFTHAWVTNIPIDGNAISQRSREYNVVFPLFIDDALFGLASNITPMAIKSFELSTGLQFSEGENRKTQITFDSLNLFAYVYGVLWDPVFRQRENQELRENFARIPLPQSAAHFSKVANLGMQLIQLHVSCELKEPTSGHKNGFIGSNLCCSRVRYHADSERLAINDSSYFEAISAEVWEFRIGAFYMVRKWLSDREFSKIERELSPPEVSQFLGLVEIVNSTLRAIAYKLP
jgi:predicted helicase